MSGFEGLHFGVFVSSPSRVSCTSCAGLQQGQALLVSAPAHDEFGGQHCQCCCLPAPMVSLRGTICNQSVIKGQMDAIPANCIKRCSQYAPDGTMLLCTPPAGQPPCRGTATDSRACSSCAQQSCRSKSISPTCWPCFEALRENSCLAGASASIVDSDRQSSCVRWTPFRPRSRAAFQLIRACDVMLG